MDRLTFPQAHQVELVALAELAGVSAVPGVFRYQWFSYLKHNIARKPCIILELLGLQVSPEDIYILLKQICPRSTDTEQAAGSESVPTM